MQSGTTEDSTAIKGFDPSLTLRFVVSTLDGKVMFSTSTKKVSNGTWYKFSSESLAALLICAGDPSIVVSSGDANSPM